MEENKNSTQEQPEQKKKKKSDVLLTIALVVRSQCSVMQPTICIISIQNTKKERMSTIQLKKWRLQNVIRTVQK